MEDELCSGSVGCSVLFCIRNLDAPNFYLLTDCRMTKSSRCGDSNPRTDRKNNRSIIQDKMFGMAPIAEIDGECGGGGGWASVFESGDVLARGCDSFWG